MSSIGFTVDEIDTSAPTRAARLKWVIIVNSGIPGGLAVNAASCVAAATAQHVSGILGGDATDADGNAHPGLPWAGCSVLSADSATLRAIRAKAASHELTWVADMPAAAQQTRVYDEYLAAVADSPADQLEYYAVSVVGPRNRVDKIIGHLPLLP